MSHSEYSSSYQRGLRDEGEAPSLLVEEAQDPQSQSASRARGTHRLLKWFVLAVTAILVVVGLTATSGPGQEQMQQMRGIRHVPAMAQPGVELESVEEKEQVGAQEKLEARESTEKYLLDPKFKPNPSDKDYTWCLDCPDRCSNVLKSLENNNIDLSAEGKSIKYKALAKAAPKFYRGTDHLYLEDMMGMLRDEKHKIQKTVAHGKTTCFNDADQHVFNFGTVQDHREQIVYDLNDFDQSIVHHYVIDLFRLSASVVMHMKLNKLHEKVDGVLDTLLTTYAESVASYVDTDDEIDFQLTRANTEDPLQALLMEVEVNSEKYSREVMLDKYTVMVPDKDLTESLQRDGDVQKKDTVYTRQLNTQRDDLEEVHPDKAKALARAWPKYVDTLLENKRFRSDYYSIKHIVAKRLGAGVGSLGNDRFYVLIEGTTLSQDDDQILDVKHEPIPEWYWHLGKGERGKILHHWSSQGERVTSGFRAMNGPLADSLLGFLEMDDGSGSYMVRARSPFKAGVDIDAMTDAKDWHSMARQWSQLLAANHARGDNDFDPKIVPHSFEKEFVKMHGKGKNDEWRDIIKEFAVFYDKRVSEDFQCFSQSTLVEPVNELKDALKSEKKTVKEDKTIIHREEKKEK
jgi:uncharacterized protein (DUF2252 family)